MLGLANTIYSVYYSYMKQDSTNSNGGGVSSYIRLVNTMIPVLSDAFPEDEYSMDILKERMNALFSPSAEGESRDYDLAIRASLELVTRDAPRWEYIAARFLVLKYRQEMEKSGLYDSDERFSRRLARLADDGLYGRYILDAYTPEELDAACGFIRQDRDHLLTYSALDLLLRRYVIRSRSGSLLESPQELFLGIALHLAMNEENRLERVREFYEVLSLLKLTVATPTLSNARKPFHQLSSCFIDTVPDSLDGIYRSLDSFAQVSKFGGGMGMYFGKVRAVGGPIRGFPGAAGGVLRWIKLANDTAVAVDQLGVRQGSVACYLDVWHKDLPEFLQLKTNNGDDRMKAHDVFPGVCYPDLFWRRVAENMDADWHLLCPHEVLMAKGWSLEDFWGEEWEKRYLECVADPTISKRTMSVKDIVRLIIKSAVETGTPFVFNRDTVNRMNPNSHAGIIYCSNLCTEIAQNMSAVSFVKREIVSAEGEHLVVETTQAGDFVVCNLASLVLGNIDLDAGDDLESTTATAVRMLDNVIDLNYYPVPYARITNRQWRPIGLGTSGYHHALAKKRIKWESEEHLAFADRLFERINHAAISASSALAAERGAYAGFEGSDWQTGEYFAKRNYVSAEWKALAESVARNGMRNAWLIAIAPTSSTSIIAGTTAGLDPVMHTWFLEEKRGMTVPRVAPDLSLASLWYYKSAHTIDQQWVIRAAGVRQRHIDQSQSLNVYITTDYTFRNMLDLYLSAWASGVKTVYYVRSRSLEVEDCEFCSA